MLCSQQSYIAVRIIHFPLAIVSCQSVHLAGKPGPPCQLCRTVGSAYWRQGSAWPQLEGACGQYSWLPHVFFSSSGSENQAQLSWNAIPNESEGH
jgi:hypothetical protein